MKNIILPLIAVVSLPAMAVKVIEKEIPETTQIAQFSNYKYIKFNLGSTFAGHMYDQEVIGGKSGFSIGQRWATGYGAEVEYIWNPTAHTSDFDNVRLDMIFANATYESPFFTRKYHPHVALGLGAIYKSTTLIETDYDNNDPYGIPNEQKYTNNNIQPAILLKVGFDHDLSEGMAWGMDYGYIHSLGKSKETSSEYNQKASVHDFSTQFINWHISLRF
jgi:hypothetical protein